MSMPAQLTDRDKAILAHVARHRISTRSIIQKLFFKGGTMDAVKGVLGRLASDGGDKILVSRPLAGVERYFQFTTHSCQAFGYPEGWARPFKHQALVTRYGSLLFCCDGPAIRKRYSREEFESDFPEFKECFSPGHDYCLEDVGGSIRLTRIKVDQGGDAARVVQTCTSIIRKVVQIRGMKELIAEGHFQVKVVTAEESKRARIEEFLAKTRLPVAVTVEAIPDLAKVWTRSAAETEAGDDDGD